MSRGGQPAVIPLPTHAGIFLYAYPADMRKNFPGTCVPNSGVNPTAAAYSCS